MEKIRTLYLSLVMTSGTHTDVINSGIHVCNVTKNIFLFNILSDNGNWYDGFFCGCLARCARFLIGVVKGVAKLKITTLGYCIGKNVAPTMLA
jgi:hypothetical protein